MRKGEGDGRRYENRLTVADAGTAKLLTERSERHMRHI
jgi:hypothetical protein